MFRAPLLCVFTITLISFLIFFFLHDHFTRVLVDIDEFEDEINGRISMVSFACSRSNIQRNHSMPNNSNVFPLRQMIFEKIFFDLY